MPIYLEIADQGRIPMCSYSHSVTMGLTPDRRVPGARTTGRSEHGEVKITRWLDHATPIFYEACANGNRLDEVRLVLVHPRSVDPEPDDAIEDDTPGESTADLTPEAEQEPPREANETGEGPESEALVAPYFTYILSDVIVTSVLTSCEDGAPPLETLMLSYGRIVWHFAGLGDEESGPTEGVWPATQPA